MVEPTDDASDEVTEAAVAETDIAIVGMAGRFPGAPTVDDLWRRVVRGDDCLDDLPEARLAELGVAPALLADPDYVRRNGLLADVEMFDPGFFAIGPRDAAIMDPQHRHFIECCWEALEGAGHVPERFAGAIGVFGGCGMNTYMLNNLLTNPTLVEQVGMFLLRHTANDKDFFTTTVSYKLDLRGPSVSVQTACSTSLVAVHLATQSLLALECDLALAGGATIESPHGAGYLYREGEILSPDGVCRAFDARSAGTVLTSGVGVVALRRLADALADGDPILAVIKGTAVNNDGQRKVGYLAPSVDGHADVVKEAFAVSGLSARNIQLLEAHGTGTAVGDPIEVAALTEAFRASTAETGFCRLVSTKPNIGHLDTAAGVASLIKVVQSLGHRTLPPLANHSAPSPLLGIEHTPFVLSGEAAPWPGDRPRRAGVSSLGVGGTNAHVIVQEPPSRPSTPAAAREQVLALSGRSADVLDDAARRLADHLEAHPDTNIADVAHTLATGRRAMAHRRVVTVTDTRSAVDVLRSQDRNRVATSVVPDDRQRVAFMFPGGGSQYNGMAAGLDARFGVFHDTMADGIARIERRSGIDLRPRLARDADADALLHTTASLPAVFLTSIALARQWMAWGVTPTTFVGHSLGEYAAAHLAGVLTLDDAIELIVGRATLMDRASGIGAAMLAVPMPVARVRGLLAPTVSVAAINADDECVVAGPVDDIEALRAKLADDDVDATLIPLAAAAHSSLLDPILPDFLDIVRRVKLSAPRVPYVSNLTGTWITAEQAIDPHYWVDHLRHTVRFADGLATLLADGPMVLMELGPGQSLSSYARRQTIKPTAAIPALRHPNQEVDDTAYSLNAFARGWAVGLDLDLDRFSGTGRRLLRLPTYPFRKERYWIEPGAGRVAPVVEAPVTAPVQTAPVPERITDLADSFWSPVWTERPRIAPAVAPVGPWLVVGDPGDPFVVALARELTACGDVVDVTTAPGPAALTVARSVILVGPTGSFDGAVERWLTTASAAARALGDVDGTPTLLAAITRGATDAGGTAVAPIDAMALGIIGTAPREYVGLRTLHLDLDPTGDPLADAAAVVAEVLEGADRIVARRGLRRLVPSTERTRLDPPPTNAMTWRRGGNYLVTGGLGGVGFAIAEHLLRVHDANVAVVATRPVPAGVARTTWLAHHGYDDPMCRRIRRLAVLESIGPKVTVVAADIADPESVRAALAEAERHVGRLDGVIHAAGELRDRPIELATHEDHEDVVGAKARGALALIDELRRRGTEQLVLVSSTSTILLPEAQAAYVAANGVLDALAGTRGSLRITTINYGLWAELGVAADMARRARLGLEPGTPVEHPVLTELSVERDGTIRVVGTLTTDHHWLVAEHRTAAGVALLPGTGHLELFVAAARAAGIADAALAGVTLVDPLVVPDGVAVTTRVSITSGPDGRWAQVESDGGGGAWRLHSEAQIVATGGSRTHVEPPARSAGAVDADPLVRPRAQLDLGPHWCAVHDSWRDGSIAAGRMRIPDQFEGDLHAWQAHPALVDVATAFGVLLGEREESLYVPVGYDSVTSHDRLPASSWVHARRDPSSTVDLLRVDLTITDDVGLVVLQIDGLALRPLDRPAALAASRTARSTAGGGGRIAPLADLAERHGIRAAEGVELLERVIASGRPRLIASSIDLDGLVEFLAPQPSVVVTSADGAMSTGPPPSVSVIGTIRTIWTDLLGVPDVGDDDDFFDIGGHSLIAIRVMSRIHKELGVRFQLAAIFDAPTIAGLTARVLAARPDLDTELAAAASASSATIVPTASDASSAVAAPLETGPAPTVAATSTSTQTLVTISATGDKAPLFIVHGAGGNILFLWSLARAMAGSRPIYGFQAHGIDHTDMPDPTVEAMAARYVRELRAAHDGPYILGGYSGGGIVTFEMVRQLQALAAEVEYLVLFDSVPPGLAQPSPAAQARNLLGNIRRHGCAPLRPYMRYRAKAAARRVIPRSHYRSAELIEYERAIGARDVEDLGFVNLFHYFSATAARYEMSTISVDAAVLKAEWVWPVQPHDYYWTRHIDGELDIIEVPGDHNAMFYPENAPRLAAVLSDVLERREQVRHRDESTR